MFVAERLKSVATDFFRPSKQLVREMVNYSFQRSFLPTMLNIIPTKTADCSSLNPTSLKYLNEASLWILASPNSTGLKSASHIFKTYFLSSELSLDSGSSFYLTISVNVKLINEVLIVGQYLLNLVTTCSFDGPITLAVILYLLSFFKTATW